VTTATSSTGTGMERPTSVGAAAELLRETRGSVVFRGGGTKMTWGGRPQEPHLIVETAGLDRLIAHNPADMTVSVEAGMPLTALQEQLADAGQWLALDPPSEVAGATIGGLLATGDSGPRRLRYGAMRDLVIGVTLVLADGRVAHAGGQVIKNVAGYDLTKLMYGSLGTLALIAEVILRVHPRTETSATVVLPCSVDTATSLSLQLLASPLEPSAVDWVGDPRGGSETGRLAVRFEGTQAGVSAQTSALHDLVGGAGNGAELLVKSAEAASWQEVVARRAASDGQTVAFAGTLPSQLPAIADALTRAADAGGLDVRLESHSALGLHTAHFAGEPVAQAAAFAGWRDAVLGMGGTVLLRDRPDAVDAALADAGGALGPEPSAVNLLRALKTRLDPDGRLAPGRLGSWI
jgi:glycolate oxidase FAD binding subunit